MQTFCGISFRYRADFIIFVRSNKESDMKNWIIIILLACIPVISQAQSEGNGDVFQRSMVKDFGGFILDMGTMLNAESLVIPFTPLPNLSLLAPAEEWTPAKLSTDAFRINPNLTYMGGTNLLPTSLSSMYLTPYGIGSGMVNWQGASYKLNNGARINLYGQYDADGHKVYNPSAMPWQRNDFNAAFEMKSANGNFGIRLEVHGGRNYPY